MEVIVPLASALARAVDRGMSEAIVTRTFVGVAEYRVGLGAFLEFFFRVGVALIAIRVVLQREFPIGALDIALAGIARYAEYLVIVTSAHAFATLTMGARSSFDPMR